MFPKPDREGVRYEKQSLSLVIYGEVGRFWTVYRRILNKNTWTRKPNIFIVSINGGHWQRYALSIMGGDIRIAVFSFSYLWRSRNVLNSLQKDLEEEFMDHENLTSLLLPLMVAIRRCSLSMMGREIRKQWSSLLLVTFGEVESFKTVLLKDL